MKTYMLNSKMVFAQNDIYSFLGDAIIQILNDCENLDTPYGGFLKAMYNGTMDINLLSLYLDVPENDNDFIDGVTDLIETELLRVFKEEDTLLEQLSEDIASGKGVGCEAHKNIIFFKVSK